MNKRKLSLLIGILSVMLLAIYFYPKFKSAIDTEKLTPQEYKEKYK